MACSIDERLLFWQSWHWQATAFNLKRITMISE